MGADVPKLHQHFWLYIYGATFGSPNSTFFNAEKFTVLRYT